MFRLVPDQVRFVEIPSSNWAGSDTTESMLIGSRCLSAPSSRSSDGSSKLPRVNAAMSGASWRGTAAANAMRHRTPGNSAKRLEAARWRLPPRRTQLLFLLLLMKHSSARRFDGGRSRSSRGKRIGGAQADAEWPRRSLRVDEAKIDALVDLAGEFLVAKNGLSHLARRVKRTAWARPRACRAASI